MVIDTSKIHAKVAKRAKELREYAEKKIAQAKPEVAFFLRKAADHIEPQPNKE